MVLIDFLSKKYKNIRRGHPHVFLAVSHKLQALQPQGRIRNPDPQRLLVTKKMVRRNSLRTLRKNEIVMCILVLVFKITISLEQAIDALHESRVNNSDVDVGQVSNLTKILLCKIL